MAIKDSLLANGNGTSPHTVPTTMRYYLDPSKGGTKVFYAGTVGTYRRKHEQCPVQVTAMNGHENEFELDKHGFTLVQHKSKVKEFHDDESTRDIVYAEASDLLKKVTGATKVLPFSHVARTQRYEDMVEEVKNKQNDDEVVDTKRIPVRFVHVDHSYDGADTILRDNFTDDAERNRLTKTRWAIMNVWRPLHHEITRDPLALCDASTVEESDLEGVLAVVKQQNFTDTKMSITSGKDFESWGVRYNPAHRWYYKKGMKPDEAYVLKIFDSKNDGRTSRRTPHTSFPSDEDHGSTRESVEIRCFVFWEDEEVQ